jgi:hypothetical protein
VNAVIQKPSHEDIEFVRCHVRRIAESLGVDEVYTDLAVFDAEQALRDGAERTVAIHLGVESAARVRVAGRGHVHRRPKLTLVPHAAEDLPRNLTKPDHWTTALMLAAAAALLAAGFFVGLAGITH